MIISRTPYRIPIGGGGTDQEFYFKKQGSFFISAALKEYVYVFVTERKLDNKIFTQTSSVEYKNNTNQISHPFIREALKFFNIDSKIQIGSFSTLPTSIGLGLGTSSSFLVGLVNSLSHYKGYKFSKIKVAQIAYKIEREILNLSGGFQDQYIASLGGLRKFNISKSGNVSSILIRLSNKKKEFYKKKFVLVYSNQQRRSEGIIQSQKKNLENSIKIYNEIKNIAKKIEVELKTGNVSEIANLFNYHWKMKKELSNEISNNFLDNQFNHFLKNGSIGGKLIGAGGGGFYLMIKNQKENQLDNFINKKGFFKIKFDIDEFGTSILKS